MDDASCSSIRAAATTFLMESRSQVTMLVSNAGIMGIKDLNLTEDRHEKGFVTIRLADLLLP